jgi:hypothetical protein
MLFFIKKNMAAKPGNKKFAVMTLVYRRLQTAGAVISQPGLRSEVNLFS